MHIRNYTRDPVLEEIINDTAKHFGLKVGTVWSLYNFYYIVIRNAVALHKYKYMTVAKLKETSLNLRIVGLGTFKHKFGKKKVIKDDNEERNKRRSEKRKAASSKINV